MRYGLSAYSFFRRSHHAPLWRRVGERFDQCLRAGVWRMQLRRQYNIDRITPRFHRLAARCLPVLSWRYGDDWHVLLLGGNLHARDLFRVRYRLLRDAGRLLLPARDMRQRNLGANDSGSLYADTRGRKLVNALHEYAPMLSTDHYGECGYGLLLGRERGLIRRVGRFFGRVGWLFRWFRRIEQPCLQQQLRRREQRSQLRRGQ